MGVLYKRKRLRVAARRLFASCKRFVGVLLTSWQGKDASRGQIEQQEADHCQTEATAQEPAKEAKPKASLCADFDITSDVQAYPTKRRQHGKIQRAVVDDDEATRREARAAKFAAEAARPPPPLPTSRVAWHGGSMTTNRKDATRRFLERCGDSLTPDQKEAALAAIEN